MDYSKLIQALWENNYIHSLIILVSFFIFGKIVVYVSEKWLLKLAEKTKTKVDDYIVERTNKPISVLLLFIGMKIAFVPLKFGIIMGFDIDDIAGKIINSLITIVIAKIIITVFDIIIDEWGKNFAKKTKSKLDDQLVSLFHRFSKIVFIILAFVFILDSWGFKVGPFLASLGIAGIAIAFALQSTLANIFGGVSMILDKSVKVGDVVRLDADTMGKVIDVGLRSTKIKTFNNEVVVVPNGKLVDSNIENFVLPDPSARVVVKFGVEYGADVDKVKKIIIGEIKKLKNVLKEPNPQVLFLEMGDFALLFEARFWVAEYTERLSTKEKANCLFYNALNKAKIGIPFPTQTVYVKK